MQMTMQIQLAIGPLASGHPSGLHYLEHKCKIKRLFESLGLVNQSFVNHGVALFRDILEPDSIAAFSFGVVATLLLFLLFLKSLRMGCKPGSPSFLPQSVSLVPVGFFVLRGHV